MHLGAVAHGVTPVRPGATRYALLIFFDTPEVLARVRAQADSGHLNVNVANALPLGYQQEKEGEAQQSRA